VRRASGEIRYRTECSGPWVTHVSHDRVAPVEVPAAEAEKLAPGNYVYVIAGGKPRSGRVVQVFAAEKDVREGSPIQLRAFRTP